MPQANCYLQCVAFDLSPRLSQNGEQMTGWTTKGTNMPSGSLITQEAKGTNMPSGSLITQRSSLIMVVRHSREDREFFKI
jgi:hypothetical protein